ncbi:hypothetical protein [Eubacterium limosum]|uniref:hypothetical protein n=1 Tax=Eubacterium limosum TaxID=1736 RepID=UPI00106358C7|nr:hypothetical protein [Eubacterium limosum]
MDKKFNLIAAIFIILFFSMILIITSTMKIQPGSWESESDSTCCITLYPDDTFESDIYGNGTYTVQKTEITLHSSTDITLTIIRKPLKLVLYDRQSQNYFHPRNTDLKK